MTITTEELRNRVAAVVTEMTTLRRKIHSYPEPAYEEYRTAAEIVGYLQAIEDMEITTGYGKTGVVALLGKDRPGPCLALRADMDCLRMQENNLFAHASRRKGLMHGCGHDGHVAALVGAALVLGSMADGLSGPVKYIFQPGEENAAGAKEVIADGALENPVPKAIFALHGTPSLPLGSVGLRRGAMMATSRYFTITVTGKGAHAAMPHKGIDCVLVASHIVCAVHSIISRNINPLEAALISIPSFNASKAPNVLPAEVTLQGTLRALSDETREFLETRLRDVATHTASSFGAEANVEFEGGYPLLVNDGGCHEYLLDAAVAVVGQSNVRSDYPPSLGAEDFAFYLERVPGAFCWLGLGVDETLDAPLHNPCFDFNDDALGRAIELYCHLALGSRLL